MSRRAAWFWMPTFPTGSGRLSRRNVGFTWVHFQLELLVMRRMEPRAEMVAGMAIITTRPSPCSSPKKLNIFCSPLPGASPRTPASCTNGGFI